MNDRENLSAPPTLSRIEQKTRELDFKMASDHLTGSLLRTLASARPSSRILELGTGTGLSTCWILDGMNASSKLFTVDNDPTVAGVAMEFLSSDLRVEFFIEDGTQFLNRFAKNSIDLIFADTWPGKYHDLDNTLDLLAEGGLYVIDDMTPQQTWQESHLEKAEKLIHYLESREDLSITKLNWSTGIILCVKKAK